MGLESFVGAIVSHHCYLHLCNWIYAKYKWSTCISHPVLGAVLSLQLHNTCLSNIVLRVEGYSFLITFNSSLWSRYIMPMVYKVWLQHFGNGVIVGSGGGAGKGREECMDQPLCWLKMLEGHPSLCHPAVGARQDHPYAVQQPSFPSLFPYSLLQGSPKGTKCGI